MEKNWKKVHIGSNPIQMEIIKQILEENDIKSVILNKQDSSYRFGNIELYVHEENEVAAQKLILDVQFEEELGEDSEEKTGE